MNYNKFFNSNPSVSGNNAMSNIEALAKFDTWLAGQEIISITAGAEQEGYIPLIFTKENGDIYTVNAPIIKGDTGATGQQGPKGDTGLEALSITSVYESDVTPSINGDVVLTTDDFNRTPITNERCIMFVVTNDNPDVSKAYITEVTVNSISDTSVNCMYNSVNEIITSTTVSSFIEMTRGLPISGIKIETRGSFQLNDTKYIHFVTLTTSDNSFVINTFCITNSANNPTLDDFNSFLTEVAPDKDNCIMASGRYTSILNGKLVVKEIIDGVYYNSNTIIRIRSYSLDSF